MSATLFITEPIHEDAQLWLRERASTDIGHEGLSQTDIQKRVSSARVILSKSDPLIIDASIMAAAPDLLLVARHGSGFSNVDIDYATTNGVAVSVTAGVNASAISEYTVGLMLAAARCIPQASVACVNGAPDRQQFTGVELTGKIFGIVGVGRIGRAVVERVSAFGMRVLAYHPRPSAKYLTDLPLDLVDLETLLSQSDVVSLHMPLTNETTNLIAEPELLLMKPRAILLNLSRGGVVNEKALFNALLQGQIFAAATDVLAKEPVQCDEPLLSLQNCIVLPHIAAMTFETQQTIAMTAARQCLQAIAGKVPENIVNPDALKHPKWTSIT